MTPELIADEKLKFYTLTKYFLTNFKNTGKTFVLQNWEGDGSLGLGWNWDDYVPTTNELKGMIDWLNARQDGVEQARQECGMKGVYVYHAAEVNLVLRAMNGTGNQKITCINNVIPFTHCDLYSYSAYDSSTTGNPVILRNALNYMRAHAPDSAIFGSNNIYIGEYGFPQNDPGNTGAMQYSVCKSNVETFLDFGVKYMLYWELYCNEPITNYTGRPVNSDLRGFWLIRPNGTKSLLWDYFAGLLQ
jgi:hypothetical protein